MPIPYTLLRGAGKSCCLLLLLAGATPVPRSIAQSAVVRPAAEYRLPSQADGNSPLFWFGDKLHLFTSIGWPQQLSVADEFFGEWETQRVDARDFGNKTVWVESALVDETGVLCGWYHHEPGGLYADSQLTVPKIGATMSLDGGRTLIDFGFVLESGDAPDETAENGFFTGGHGDFSVIADRERRYLYFFFTNYGGPDESQGICVARMAYVDRFAPVGKVFKYHQGRWDSPGLGGPCTPIFTTMRPWRHIDPHSFWGPAIHWNTHLKCYVMLLNLAGGEPGWSQQGVFISYVSDLAQPHTWRRPTLLLPPEEIRSWSSFYPQVIGLAKGETDSVVGRTARLFLTGISTWEIEFTLPPPATPPPPKVHLEH
jgi:hypothetical protein